MKKNKLICLATLVLALGVVGCGGDNGGNDEPPIDHVHNYVEDASRYVAPTCETDGKKVSVCECGVIKESTVSKLGHHLVKDEAASVAATCQAAGVEVMKCDREGCDHVERNELPKTDHVYTAGTKVGDVTPLTDAVCGAKAYEMSISDASGWNQAGTKWNTKSGANTTATWDVNGAIPGGRYSIALKGMMTYSSHGIRKFYNMAKAELCIDGVAEETADRDPDTISESDFRYFFSIDGGDAINPDTKKSWSELGYTFETENSSTQGTKTGDSPVYATIVSEVDIPWGMSTFEAHHGNIGFSMIVAAVRLDLIEEAAHPKSEAVAPTGIKAAVNSTLADVRLPEGWSWVTPTTNVGSELGNKTFKAVFQDSRAGYLPSDPIDVTVEVKTTIVSYTIKIMNGETEVRNESVDEGTSIVNPGNPTNKIENKMFSKWVFKGTENEVTFPFTISENTEIEAVWVDCTHDWKDDTGDGAKLDPTCTEGGFKNQTCDICGATQKLDLDAKGHNPVVLSKVDELKLTGVDNAYVPATCKTVGLGHKKCSNCGAITEYEIPVDGLNGHNWSDAVKSQIDVGEGVMKDMFTRYCLDCGVEDIYVVGKDYATLTGSMKSGYPNAAGAIKLSSNNDAVTFKFTLSNVFNGVFAIEGCTDNFNPGSWSNNSKNTLHNGASTADGYNLSFALNGQNIPINNDLNYEEMGQTANNSPIMIKICNTGDIPAATHELEFKRLGSYNPDLYAIHLIGTIGEHTHVFAANGDKPNVAASCSAEGKSNFKCACGVEASVFTPKIDHSFGQDGICTSCGAIKLDIPASMIDAGKQKKNSSNEFALSGITAGTYDVYIMMKDSASNESHKLSERKITFKVGDGEAVNCTLDDMTGPQLGLSSSEARLVKITELVLSEGETKLTMLFGEAGYRYAFDANPYILLVKQAA